MNHDQLAALIRDAFAETYSEPPPGRVGDLADVLADVLLVRHDVVNVCAPDPDEDGSLWFKDGDVIVYPNKSGGKTAMWNGEPTTPNQLRYEAGELLAAARAAEETR